MSKSSNIAVWIVLALPLLTAPLWADGIINGGSTNNVTFSGQTTFPAGTSGAPSITDGTATCGLFFEGGGIQLSWACQAHTNVNFNSNTSLRFISSLVLGWVNGDADANNPDTGFSRDAPGIIDVGTGAAGSKAGSMNMAAITTTASVTFSNLVVGTNADFLCLAANGNVLIQTTACTVSSLRFKPDWKSYTGNALTKISAMEVGTFHTNIPNNDPNWQTEQAGLNAENIAKIAPECAVYENDMKTPKSYRQECVIALLVRSIQDLQHRLNVH